MTREIYSRSTDAVEMIEVAPHQYVNAEIAMALGLVSPLDLADARKHQSVN